MSFFSDFIAGLVRDAQSFGVSPMIFVALYLITWPMWYYTMWWVVSGWHRKDRSKMVRGVWSNRFVTVLPYAYVLVAGGKGMPWTWYAFAVGIPLVTTSMFLHKTKDDVWMDKWWDRYQAVLIKFKRR